MSKATHRVQAFISLEAHAALKELMECNEETATRAIELALLERTDRLLHRAVEQMQAQIQREQGENLTALKAAENLKRAQRGEKLHTDTSSAEFQEWEQSSARQHNGTPALDPAQARG